MYGVGFDAGSQVPGGRGVGLDTLCDVVDNLGSEAGRAGLSPAAAETRPDQDHPPAEAAGGQGDTDTRECPPPESLDPQRLDAARQLKKGNPLWSSSSLTGWKPAKTKPSKLELWQACAGPPGVVVESSRELVTTPTAAVSASASEGRRAGGVV